MLKVDKLAKRFNIHILNNKVIDAFSDISFHVEKGRFLGLSGPSGSGKSSILKCIYRTYLPTEGSIRFDSAIHGEVDMSSASDQIILDIRRKEVGYVSQFLKIIPRVPAIDIVAEPLVAKNMMRLDGAREAAVEILRKLKIPSHLFDAYPSSFSGGEQQRINIARAIIWSPRLLLLDEPTASLDKESIEIVIDLLKTLRTQGTTMIGIFHDRDVMNSVADSVYELHQEVAQYAA